MAESWARSLSTWAMIGRGSGGGAGGAGLAPGFTVVVVVGGPPTGTLGTPAGFLVVVVVALGGAVVGALGGGGVVVVVVAPGSCTWATVEPVVEAAAPVAPRVEPVARARLAATSSRRALG